MDFCSLAVVKESAPISLTLRRTRAGGASSSIENMIHHCAYARTVILPLRVIQICILSYNDLANMLRKERQSTQRSKVELQGWGVCR